MSAKKRRPSVMFQRRIEGGRIPVHGALDPKVEQAVAQEMARFKVSRAYVISLAVAVTLGVDIESEDNYRGRDERTKHRLLKLVGMR